METDRSKALAMGHFEVTRELKCLVTELHKPSRLLAEQAMFEQSLRNLDEIMRRVEFCG